jgi:hypothetical protein
VKDLIIHGASLTAGSDGGSRDKGTKSNISRQDLKKVGGLGGHRPPHVY